MVKLSIVVVLYKNVDSLADCLQSIPVKDWIEVIVVNNSVNNRGFGKGCNVGSSYATGDYVLFLNPDCVVDEKALEIMVDKLEKDPQIGILGPKLLDIDGTAYLSCSEQPTRITAPIVYSVLNKFFHNSKLVRRFWYNHTPPAEQQAVGIVSGAAMLMRKKVFDSLKGFDEQIFLYWEEVDLAKRAIERGYKVVFEPLAAIHHEQGTSTALVSKAANKWFKEARYYFFSKYFGKAYGLALESWFTLCEEWKYVLGIVIVLLVAIVQFSMGSWLKPELFYSWQLQLLDKLPWLNWWYWLWVIGAIGSMTIVYNEIAIKTKLVHLVLTVVVGLTLLIFGPAAMVLSLLTSLLWLVLDNLKNTQRLRQTVAALLLSGMVLLLPRTASRLQTPTTQSLYTDTLKIIELVNIRTEKSSIDVECIQCKSLAELTMLKAMLRSYNIAFEDRENVQLPRKYFVHGPFVVHWDARGL